MEQEINEIIKEIGTNFLEKQSNGMMLRRDQISILKKYSIDYLKYTNIESLIYEIEEILNIEYFEDLDNLSQELAEFNYYNNTNK